jgi:hypothetical protein
LGGLRRVAGFLGIQSATGDRALDVDGLGAAAVALRGVRAGDAVPSVQAQHASTLTRETPRLAPDETAESVSSAKSIG